MKLRILTIAIATAVLFSLTSCFSEGIDLDSLSETELVDLQFAVQSKIFELDPLSNLVFYPGHYIVGKDIEPGTYLIMPIKNVDSKWDQDFFDVYVYESKEARDNSESAIDHHGLHYDSPYKMTLEEGNFVSLSYAVYTMTKLK